MTIEPKDATHIRLKVAVYPSSEFLTAGTIHKVTSYEGHAWRVVDPAYPDDRMKDYWIAVEAGIAEPCEDPAAPLKGDAKTNLPNPKQAYGDKKPPLDEFPLSAMIHASLAHLDGDNKYGFRNWRDYPVEARTYIKGAMRHLRLFEVGEDMTRDSNVHNLGAVIAGCAILIDSQLHGTMIDNRRHSKAEADLLHSAEDIVAALNELQRGRDAKKLADEEARRAVEGVPLPDDHPVDPEPEAIPAFLPTRAFPPSADLEDFAGLRESDYSSASVEFPDNPGESFGSHLDGDSLIHLKPTSEEEERSYRELGF